MAEPRRTGQELAPGASVPPRPTSPPPPPPPSSGRRPAPPWQERPAEDPNLATPTAAEYHQMHDAALMYAAEVADLKAERDEALAEVDRLRLENSRLSQHALSLGDQLQALQPEVDRVPRSFVEVPTPAVATGQAVSPLPWLTVQSPPCQGQPADLFHRVVDIIDEHADTPFKATKRILAALREAGWLDPQQADDLRALDVRAAEVERLGAEVDRMRPVVEAAQAWSAALKEIRGKASPRDRDDADRYDNALIALAEAVDAFVADAVRSRPILLSGQTVGEETRTDG